MLLVARLIAIRADYPDQAVYGVKDQFERMVALWRPQLLTSTES